MPVTWTIKGEAGRSVDATERELSSLQMQGISPSFASLASDGISWQAWLRNTSQIPGLVPDYGQKISLYRNGVRYFCGHVTLRKPLFTAERFGYSLRVDGPWWWLDQTSISSVVPDQSTTAAERAMYVFPAATVRTNLIALIYRAIALGLPISEGSIASNLLATQNHVPVEGSIDVVLDDPGPGNACGCAVNVSGFLPDTANMRAMVSGHSVNLRTGATSYRFNPPDRLAYRDLVNRFRQSGADNIYYLVDSVSGDPGENPPPDPELEVPVGPPNALTYNGEYLMFDGDYITFTPAPESAPTFNGAILTFNGAALTFTPNP